ERLDDPEADVRTAPQTDLLGPPPTEEQPLRCDRNGADNKEDRGGGQDQSQVNRPRSRARRDPAVALHERKHGNLGVDEEEQGLQRSAEEILPPTRGRRRLERLRYRRLGMSVRPVR